jgi:kynurenine formamidase
VDLSHAYGAATLFWPTEEGFQLQKQFAGINEKGYYYASNRFCTAEHGGTHIDAPVHFAQGRQSVDQIPLERLIGPGVVVDVSAQCAADRDYEVQVKDFEAWEKANGPMPRQAIVLLYTGFGKRWPDAQRYLGTAEHGPQAVAKLHFPGLAPKAAEWLAGQRKIKMVGLDTASIDHGPSTMFETHRVLMGRNIPALENVANLDQLPKKGFTVIALPMKIAGGSGGPVRIVAAIP